MIIMKRYLETLETNQSCYLKSCHGLPLININSYFYIYLNNKINLGKSIFSLKKQHNSFNTICIAITEKTSMLSIFNTSTSIWKSIWFRIMVFYLYHLGSEASINVIGIISPCKQHSDPFANIIKGYRDSLSRIFLTSEFLMF